MKIENMAKFPKNYIMEQWLKTNSSHLQTSSERIPEKEMYVGQGCKGQYVRDPLVAETKGSKPAQNSKLPTKRCGNCRYKLNELNLEQSYIREPSFYNGT